MKVKMSSFDEFADETWEEDDGSAELVGNLILRICRMSVNEIELVTHFADRLLAHRKEAA